MKKIIAILFFFFTVSSFAQEQTNPFAAAEENTEVQSRETVGTPIKETSNFDNPGNPGGEVPIDSYIPLLVLVAVGIIVFKTRRKSGSFS